MPYGNAVAVEAFAAKIRDESFIHQRSFLTGEVIWTKNNFQELYEAYNLRLDLEQGTFENKLTTQLKDVSSDARQLFAELYILDLLPLGNVSARKKKQNIALVLDACNPKVELTDEVEDVFEAGVFNGAQGYNTYRWGHLVFAIELGLELMSLSLEERKSSFSSPNAIESTVYYLVTSNTGKGRSSFQKALCYLFAPEYFEPIISNSHLAQIARHFSSYLEGGEEEFSDQRKACLIRQRIASERQADGWNFYIDQDEWLDSTAGSPSPSNDSEEPDEEAPKVLSLPQNMAEEFLVSDNWLQRFLRILEAKKQVILQGPPGTGKTYLARRIARNLAGVEDRIKLVQFHPAYTYEDFFEGFRPVLSQETGTVNLQLRQGPLRQLAEEAAENPDQNYFLIIDEINRGNLARIFGELYFLLEYRKATVDLMYSQDSFSLPANLYIIGTMNTADRSIALVDSAMRRRFAFFNLHPDEEPTQFVLSKWADKHKLQGDALTAWENINQKIPQKDLKIGPSYFMKPEAFTTAGLQEIWDSEIIPLLEEYFYGERDQVASKYSLRKILNQADESSQ